MRAILALLVFGSCEAFLHASLRPRLAPSRSVRLAVTVQLREPEVPVDVAVVVRRLRVRVAAEGTVARARRSAAAPPPVAPLARLPL